MLRSSVFIDLVRRDTFRSSWFDSLVLCSLSTISLVTFPSVSHVYSIDIVYMSWQLRYILLRVCHNNYNDCLIRFNILYQE
jgi:hypothetical protein